MTVSDAEVLARHRVPWNLAKEDREKGIEKKKTFFLHMSRGEKRSKSSKNISWVASVFSCLQNSIL